MSVNNKKKEELALSNEDLKAIAKKSGLYLWQVADIYGLSDTNFSKLLRKELPDEKKNRILAIIKELSTRKGK